MAPRLTPYRAMSETERRPWEGADRGSRFPEAPIDMFTGTYADLSDLLKTAPWGTEQTVSFSTYTLDGERGWSVLLLANPLDDEAEGIVYAYDRAKKRAVIVGIAKAKTVHAANSMLGDDADNRDLHSFAVLLQRSDESGLIG